MFENEICQHMMKKELLNAIEKIKTGKWTYEEASEITKISKGTLAARISHGSSNHIGRSTALTHTEEEYLVKLGSGKMRTRNVAHGTIRTETCTRRNLRTERSARMP